MVAVSFGAASQEAERAVNRLEKALSIPGYDLFRAYTSQRIRERLQRERGLHVLSFREQLEALEKAGYEEILCQPLMISEGIEYQGVLADLTQYVSRFRVVKAGKPLLSQEEDYLSCCQWMAKQIFLREEEGAALMLHGRDGARSLECDRLNDAFSRLGYYRFVAGVMKGEPSWEKTADCLKHLGCSKVVLIPFLLTAGSHSKKDLAGKEKNSWQSRFLQKGYEVRVIEKGLGEYDEICKLFCKHAEEAK